MTSNKLETLKSEYTAVVRKYCEVFAEKHELGEEPFDWVAEDIGGVINFGDNYYFNFDDIRTDIDRDAPIDEIFSWYNHCMRLHTISEDIPTPNYRSWLSGCPRLDEDQIQRLEEAHQAVLNAEAVLRQEINIVKAF